MTLRELASQAGHEIRNWVAEEAFLRLGVDRTRPTYVYADFTGRCNLRCRSCGYWRSARSPEMTSDQWRTVLGGLAAFLGPFRISLSGGEPLIKPGLIEVLRFCRRNSISAGVTTNGWALDEQMAHDLVAARPFNVNISLDGACAKTHDYLRGRDGSFVRAVRGLELMRSQQDEQKIRFPITIKQTVSRYNFREMSQTVRLALDHGATAVNLQPIIGLTPEASEELWIEEALMPELKSELDELASLLRRGLPILVSEETLLSWPAHFRRSSDGKRRAPCRIGLRTLFISANGEARICYDFPVIGDLKETSARTLWYSEQAKRIRKATTACSRLCLSSCTVGRGLLQKARMAGKLFLPRR